jgi:hypothetical protein
MDNILRLTVAYLNATINVKPETQNRRLEPTGLAEAGETRGLTGTGPGLAHQESAGRVFGRFWNQTDPFLRSKPGPLAGYPVPLLTLSMMMTRELRRCMTAAVEDMKVGNPVRVSHAGLRNGGESEELQFRSRLYGLKILQGKNVLYDSLLF